MKNPLSATILCREAIMLFRQIFAANQPPELALPPSIPFWGPQGQYWIGACIKPTDLGLPLEIFSSRIVWPLMADLFKRVPRGKLYPLPIPLGLSGSDNLAGASVESFDGVTMRCVISEQPLPDGSSDAIWREIKEYYDVGTESLKTGPVCLVIRFDVRTSPMTPYKPIEPQQAA